MEKTEKRTAEEHKRWVIDAIVKLNPRVTKESAKSAYDFAESILGEPVCSPDDTIVTGFLAGAKFAAQELDAYKARLKEGINKIKINSESAVKYAVLSQIDELIDKL